MQKVPSAQGEEGLWANSAAVEFSYNLIFPDTFRHFRFPFFVFLILSFSAARANNCKSDEMWLLRISYCNVPYCDRSTFLNGRVAAFVRPYGRNILLFKEIKCEDAL